MCGSQHEPWRRRCDDALLVTLSVIYLEFKAHLTSMATTTFCSDTQTEGKADQHMWELLQDGWKNIPGEVG